MSIQELIRNGAGKFSGIFRTHPSRRERAENGVRYIRFGLLDDTGHKVRARGWDNCYFGPGEIPKGCRLMVRGRLKYDREHWVADIFQAEILPEDQASQPILAVAALQLDPRLQRIVTGLTLAPLRDFAGSVLSDPCIGPRFLMVPASRNHHHNFPGGLLQHSLECARIVASCPGFGRFEREVGIVAALLHDVAKIRTHQLDGRMTPMAWLVGHDNMTLEVLAGHLSALDRTCADAAHALRHIWSWLGERHPRRPSLIGIANLVSMADQLSCHLNVQQRAFDGRLDWMRIGELGGRRYFRPSPALRDIEIRPEVEHRPEPGENDKDE